MFENLKDAEIKFESISEDLTKIEIISDTERFTKLMKEHKRIELLLLLCKVMKMVVEV